MELEDLELSPFDKKGGLGRLGADMCISGKPPLSAIASHAYAQLRRYTEGCYTGGPVPFGYRAEKAGRLNKKNQDVRDLVVEPDEAQ